MESEIRQGSVEDAASIADILNYYIINTTITFEMNPISADEMKRRILDIVSNYPFFVYTEDGKLKGYCYVHQWKERKAYDTTAETSIYLHPTVCQSGIGLKLMTRLIEECQNRGLKTLIACVTEENTSSVHFHEKLGFEKVSHFRAVGRKFDRWLDVIDFQLILS